MRLPTALNDDQVGGPWTKSLENYDNVSIYLTPSDAQWTHAFMAFEPCPSGIYKKWICLLETREDGDDDEQKAGDEKDERPSPPW